ncbi:hypothetical protein Dsin_030176 [Dipteronia sinensis]|uniref:Reverse transcriptase zinc-binding domain-containing protein n=1 Tax=Dipteronia sinensis TaxID=43782 RepID=A0AAD9ZIZ3_9ROSI|nr:hypothetical protein Dsin_030176 [Dipteronia sinensis]
MRAIEEQDLCTPCLVKFNWQGICPQRASFFVWQLLKDRIFVRYVIHRFVRSQTINTDCPLCNKEVESSNHLLLHYRWTWRLWAEFMGWWGVNCWVSNSIKEWADGWSYLSNVLSCDRAWNSVFFAVVWTIWESMNQKVFNEKGVEFSVAVDSIKFRVACWFKFHGRGSDETITTILLNISDLCKEPKRIKKSSFDEWMPLSSIFESNLVELLAIEKACSLVVSNPALASHVIEIFGDLKVAVSWINDDGIGSLKYVNKVYDCIDIIRSHGGISVSFNSRSTNSFDDNLAKKGSSVAVDIIQ